jgi:adenylate kinase
MKLSKKPLIIILLGPPGSGKGTQAKLLEREFGLEYIGSGRMVRQRQQVKDFTGRKLLVVSWRKGEIVPTFLISKLWAGKLEKLKENPKFRGFVLDGSPRKLIEAELIDEALNWYEWQKNVKIILINISERESISRLTKRRICQNCGRIIPYIGELKKLKKCDKCGGKLITRADDTIKGVKERLRWFKADVKPAINYYQKKGRLIKINGEQSIEKVFKDILKAIK